MDVGTQVSLADITAARERIKGYIHHTPVMRCSYLDSIVGLQLHFKCENFQKTGSFKVCTVVYGFARSKHAPVPPAHRCAALRTL